MNLLIVPFKVISEKDMAFLSNGIFDMLTSRLAQHNKVVVTDRDDANIDIESSEIEFNLTAIEKSGNKLGADYVLWGVLKESNDTFNMEIKMVDVKGGKEVIDFSVYDKRIDEIIPAISDISSEINKKVFESVDTFIMKTDGKEKDTSNIHIHPDKLMDNKE